MKRDELLRIICRIGEKPGEETPTYSVDAVDDHPVHIGVEELGILQQDQPGCHEYFPPAMREVGF